MYLVDDHDIRHSQNRFTRIVRGEMIGAQCIDDDDVKVRAIEGEIVIAAIPQNYVGFCFGLIEDSPVIDTRIDDGPGPNMWLVFLPLFNGAIRAPKFLDRFEPLNPLPCQISIRHGVTHKNIFQIP